MKLFIKNDCDFCSQIRANEINVKTINIDDENYQGAMPQGVPMLSLIHI